MLNRSLTTYFTHAFDFVKPNVAVDLHWQLSAQLSPPLGLRSDLAAEATFNLRDQDFLVLSDEYEVVFHIVSIFKELGDGYGPFKNVHRSILILSKVSHQIDWEAFLECRKRERIRRCRLLSWRCSLDSLIAGTIFGKWRQWLRARSKLLKLSSGTESSSLMETSPGARGTNSGLLTCTNAPGLLCSYGGSCHFHFA